MDHEEIVLEEGELSDSDDAGSGNYTPLQRPQNYSSVQPLNKFPPVIDSESEIEISSDSDSDSDAGVRKSKKPKIKLKKPKPQHNPKKKKYDIWSTRVQEDVLSETLNSCDVTFKDRSRDIESYDYTIGAKHYAELEQRKDNKRTRDDRKNVNFKQKKRSNNEEKIKGSIRKILDLVVTEKNSEDEIATDIANKLCEEKVDLILKVIKVMGKEKSISIFNETKDIEEDGGMLIKNQTRRRTPGGVFLYLVRNDYHITPEQRDSIFDEDKTKHKAAVRMQQKHRNAKRKQEIAESRAKLLPDLLTRAELLACQNNRTRKETDDRDVINPPPTPETDCHDNSGDGMDNILPSPVPLLNGIDSLGNCRGKLEAYTDDFLDISCSNDMDLF